jgi:hypothetical protein
VSKALEQVLGYTYLTGLIRAVETGIPDVLPPGFQTVKRQVVGNTALYTVVKGTRRTPRINAYGSPAHQRNQQPVDTKPVKLQHTFEHVTFDLVQMQNLRQYDSYEMQQMGKDELNRQADVFRTLFDNGRLACLYSMLTQGAIYYDANSNLLPSSSGAIETIPVGMAANNQNHLNGIISASWATSTTDIPGQLRLLKQRALQLTGYPLKYAFYGSNVVSYLTTNTYVKDFLSRSPLISRPFLETGEMPELFGLTWIPVYTAFYEDWNGVNQTFWGPDTVTFTPEVTPRWYELIEGSYPVPTSLAPSADIFGAAGSIRQEFGMFSYAVPSHNPPTAQLFYGDTYLPVIKVPDACYQAVVNP